MKAAEQTEYIVQCIREAGSMYEKDARSFLTEHDAHVRATAREEAADWFASYPLGDDTSDWARGRGDNLAWVIGILRNPDPQRGQEQPEFFQPGHAYTHRDGTDFKCVAVTTHPQTGERLAMGWHVDSWALHYPATCGINQWNHEYDGVQAPPASEAGQ